MKILVTGGTGLIGRFVVNKLCDYNAKVTVVSLDDLNLEGIDLISDIKLIYSNYKFSTKILAASIRTVNHVKQCACFGADVATIPLDIFEKLVKHPLTDSGLSQFTADWEKTGQSII